MSLIDVLSPTETKIAELVARGFSEKEIADKMYVSPNTVHNHTYNIRRKWKARSAVDIARKFILSIENPKQFFISLLFITIQFHIFIVNDDIDMRKTRRNQRIIYKTFRKISE